MLKNLLFICCVLLSLPSFAKGIGPVVSPTQTGFNIKFSKDGVPLAAPMTQTVTGVQVGGTVPVALSPSLALPVSASAIVTGALLGGPWGLAIGAVGAVGMLAIPAFSDAFNRAKLSVSGAGFSKADSEYCTVSPCYIYENATTRSISTACSARATSYNTAQNKYSVLSITLPGTCRMRQTGVTDGLITDFNDTLQYTAIAPLTGTAPQVPVSTADAVAALTVNAPTIAEVQALIDLNFPPEVTSPVLSGPASVSEQNVIKLGLDGTVEEISKRYDASFSPGHIEITSSQTTTRSTPGSATTTVTTNADGTTSTAVTTRPAASSSLTTSTPGTDAPKVCGLPGTPVCAVKVEEIGTPSAVSENTYAPKLDAPQAASASAIQGASSISAPSWSFSFQLPTGCAPYVTGLKGVILNVCSYQSTIHDLLSMIWAAATAFCLIGMVGRTIREA